MAFIILIYLILTSPPGYASSTCEDWFIASRLTAKTEGCLLKCAALPVDMATFDCPGKCEILCGKVEKVKCGGKGYTTGVSPGDLKIARKYPSDAIKVFRSKQAADDLTLRIFKKTGRNDESDAFRHFVWSSLVARDLGGARAKQFLDAHEDEECQPIDEKEMDIANSQVGLDFVLTRNKTGGSELDIDDIEKEALNLLKQKKAKGY